MEVGHARTLAGAWSAPALAQVITCLSTQSVTAREVSLRAVSLGLARLPATDGLSTRAAARLLLAGYRLPALVEHGSFARIREHLRAGCRVFLLLPGADDLVLHQLCSIRDEAGLIPAPAELPRRVFLPLSEFRAQWSAADHALVAAARSWDDLPTQGRRFFGGSRDLDGSYHWEAARCDTDAAGNVIRF